MAVTKTHPIKSTLKAAIDYICNPDKTDGKLLVSSFGCTVETADIEFAWTRRHAIDKGTNLGRHLIQAFEPGEVTPEEAHRIGMELAREVLGGKYEFVLTTHTDRDHVHNHLIFNAVSFTDHKHYHSNKRSYHEIRRTSDRICKEHGLSVVKNPQRHKTARSVYFAEKNGEPTRYNLMRRALDEALTMSSSWTELSAVLRKKGYVFVCDPYRRYATLRSLSAKKCMRTFRLGAEYDKEALQDRLLENQRDIRVTRRYFEFMRPYTREYARKNPPTEKYYRQRDFYLHLPRVTGYLSFFRCVAIVLGVAPLYEKEYRQPLSAECREACRRLDRFTAEITLVCREHLDTPEDVQRFLARMDREMDAISAARSKIRNKQRGCADPAERVELKKSCAACTAELSRLRKQKQTAYNMIEDNPKLKDLLACELDAWVENDPYLSLREKQALRNQQPSQEEKTIIR